MSERGPNRRPAQLVVPARAPAGRELRNSALASAGSLRLRTILDGLCHLKKGKAAAATAATAIVSRPDPVARQLGGDAPGASVQRSTHMHEQIGRACIPTRSSPYKDPSKSRLRTDSSIAHKTAMDALGHLRTRAPQLSHLRQPGCLARRSAVLPALLVLIRRRCTNGGEVQHDRTSSLADAKTRGDQAPRR